MRVRPQTTSPWLCLVVVNSTVCLSARALKISGIRSLDTSAWSSVSQVSVAGSQVCGVSTGGTAACASLSASPTAWQDLPGLEKGFAWIANSADRLWAIDTESSLFSKATAAGAAWTQVTGRCSRVTTDGKMLYAVGDHGIDANKTFIGNATGEPNWLMLLDENVRDLDGSSGIVVALRENGSTLLPPNSTAFTDSDGPFRSIACDGAVLCASQASDDQDSLLLLMRIPFVDVRFGHVVAEGDITEVVRGTFENQPVAIKQLTKARRRDVREIAMFAREASFLSQLTHERIVTFIGVAWSTPSELCIVTEFMAGGSVLNWLKQYQSEARPQGFNADKIKIALHVAHALTYLHTLEPIVLHRDIRSKNVLLTETGDAKLTGFGLAREVEGDGGDVLTTGVGSLLWMAPEVLRGEQYGEKADVYSFGVLLSELDTNELPFRHVAKGEDGNRLADVSICHLVAEGALSVQFTQGSDADMTALGSASDMVFIVGQEFRQVPTDGLLFRQVVADSAQMCGVTMDDRAYCQLLPLRGESQQTQQPWVLKGRDILSIAVYGSQIWAVNASFAVLVSPIRGAAKWTALPGRLRSIEDASWDALLGIGLDDQAVVARNVSSDIATAPTWLPLGVKARALSSISCDSNRLCAVTSQQQGVCWSTDAQAWTTLSPPSLRWVSPSGETLWALDATGSIIWSNTNDSSKWTRLATQRQQMTQLGRGSSLLCGLDSEGLASCMSTRATSASDWFAPFSSSMKTIVVNGGNVGGVTASNDAVFGGLNEFGNLAKPVESMAFDETYLCVAERESLEVSCVARFHQTWSKINANFAHMALCNATLYGLARNGTVWATSLALAETHTSAVSPPPSNSQISIIELVSSGAFGDVYRGTYRGEVVAIKRLHGDRCRDLGELTKFAQEASLMAELQHEHVVRFICVAWNSLSELSLVTEFMEGGDLRELLQHFLLENQPQGFTKTKLKIALHVAHALAYLHSLDRVVIHRDLKSKNILLSEECDAKLTDFGVAREWHDLTLTAGVGSLLWMAPEVVLGEVYDEKADVYSFGVVLSELDTNRLPFTHTMGGDHVPDVAISHLVAAGELTVQFSSAADQQIAALGRACVNVDPSQRPSATHALHCIHQVLSRLPA
ncbi:hypothetical protein ATCC90586_005023 [Pythium insidiosum]|nr:hypothetical protein ATCC90586_005023 [Pythium insidiosum]